MIKFLNKLKPQKGDKKEEKKEDKKEEKPKEEEKKEKAPKEEAPAPAPTPSPPQGAPAQGSPFPMFPYPYYQPPQGGSSEVDQKKQIMEFEKIKASVETFKEAKKDMDDKLRSFAESLGEVRSMFLQREQSIRDMQTKIEGMSEVVNSLEPGKITEERRKREKEMALITAKIERMDRVTSDLLERFAEVRETLEGLKNLKAIVDAARNVGQKLLEMEQIKNNMERMSSKLETTYLEINKHLVDLPITKSKTESLEGLTREMMKMIDDMKMGIDKAATKEDLAGVKPVVAKIPEKDEMAELEESRNEIKNLMKTLDKEFKESAISEKSYKDSVDKSKKKLEEIDKKIEAIKGAKSGGGMSKLFGVFGFGKKKKLPKPEEKPSPEKPPEVSSKEEEKEEEKPPETTEPGVITQAMEVVEEEKPEKEEEKPPEEDKESKARKELITKIKKKEIDKIVKPKSEEAPAESAPEEKPPTDKSAKPELEKKLKKVVQLKKKEEEESVTPKQAREDLLKKLKLR